MRIDIIQQFIGRLYIDSAFLELFINCRDIALGFVDLEEEEIDFLKKINIEKVRKINDIIREKCLSVLESCFPYFSEFHADMFFSLTAEFLRIPGNYSSSRAGRLEMCKDFCSFVAQKINGFKHNNFPGYLRDLVLFEYLSKSCADIHISGSLKYSPNSTTIKPSAKPVFHNYGLMQHFRWPIMEIVNSLKRKEIPKNIEKEDCTLIFAPHKSKSKILQISGYTHLLIDFLNGEHQISDLYKMFGKEHQERIGASLEFLSSNNLLLCL